MGHFKVVFLSVSKQVLFHLSITAFCKTSLFSRESSLTGYIYVNDYEPGFVLKQESKVNSEMAYLW